MLSYFFFFSSRRRHTRFKCDWSSDVCSSDLYFCLMGVHDSDKLAVREEDGRGPLQEFLAAQAAKHRIWLVGGTVPLASPADDRVLNTALVYDPEGRRAARYDKIHLFSFQRDAQSSDESRPICPAPPPSTFALT